MKTMSSHVDLMLTACGTGKKHVQGVQRGDGASLTVTWKYANMRESSEIVFYFGSSQIADFANSYLESSETAKTKATIKPAFPIPALA